jgi:hypothetical protein
MTRDLSFGQSTYQSSDMDLVPGGGAILCRFQTLSNRRGLTCREHRTRTRGPRCKRRRLINADA